MDEGFLFNNLKSKIQNAPKIRAMEYFNLLKKITNCSGFSSSTDEINSIIGPDLVTTFSVLDKSYVWPNDKIYEKIYENVNMDDELIKEMEKWLETNLQAHYIFETKIILINNWIDSQKINKDISIDIINDFEKRIALNHDWSLTKIDGRHVIRLFNDGEINSTKSGHCYGDRSIFTSHPPLINYPKVKFPVQYFEEISYVVLPTEELAIKFRNEMSEMMKI